MPLVKLLVFLMSKSGEALQFILPAEYRDIADKAFKEAMQEMHNTMKFRLTMLLVK